MGLLDRFRPITVQRGDRAIRIARRHAIYLGDIERYFDYYHGAVEPIVRRGVAVVDYSRPRWHMLRPSGDCMRFTGLAEPEVTTDVYLAHAALQSGDLVLDLGAYCGGSTVTFARAVGPDGHVVAFEPDPVNAAALHENLAHHRCTNVTVVPEGVWATTGTVDFAAEGNMGSAATAVLPRVSPSVSVPVKSLSDAVTLALSVSGRPRIAFVKVDIEGAEVPVFAAAIDTLRRHRPRLAIEPHFDRAGTLTTDAVAAALHDAGYRTVVVPGVESHPMLLATPA